MNSDLADVLVVGAGPTGLMAAIQLRKHGVSRVRVIERDLTRKAFAKAAGVQSRSIEILQGLSDNFYENYSKRTSNPTALRNLNYSRNVEVVVPADLINMHVVEQWHTEKCLEEHLLKVYDVTVERGVSIVNFHDSGSEVQLETENKQMEKGNIRASYVIAADGGKSMFRKMLKIDFPGTQMPLEYAICQATYELETDEATMTLGAGSHGFILDFPLPDPGERVTLFDLTPEQKAQCRPDSPSEEDIARLCRERGLRVLAVRDPTWAAYLKFQSRQATKYRVGRIFLVGDAGHVHSPVLGQGMNMGLQDAHNLAWKLALVINGHAKPALLDTYHEERHEIDRKTVAFVEKAHGAAQFRHPALLYLRESATYVAGFFPALQQQIAMTVGQTGYSYGFSSLSIEDWKPPSVLFEVWQRREMNIRRHAGVRVRAGERAPNATVKFAYAVPELESKKSNDLFQFFNQTQLPKSTIPGFQALLFEGLGQTNINLVTLAQEIQAQTHGLVTSCGVISRADSAAHKLYGVTNNPCLFLIRPDGYVGLRTEPARLDSVLHYFELNVHSSSISSLARFHPTDRSPLVAFGTWALVLGLLLRALSQDNNKSQSILQRATSTPLRAAALLFLAVTAGAGLKTVHSLRS